MGLVIYVFLFLNIGVQFLVGGCRWKIGDDGILKARSESWTKGRCGDDLFWRLYLPVCIESFVMNQTRDSQTEPYLFVWR